MGRAGGQPVGKDGGSGRREPGVKVRAAERAFC